MMHHCQCNAHGAYWGLSDYSNYLTISCMHQTQWCLATGILQTPNTPLSSPPEGSNIKDDRAGDLDGLPPMSHVYFIKWQCLMSLSLIFPNVTCRV